MNTRDIPKGLDLGLLKYGLAGDVYGCTGRFAVNDTCTPGPWQRSVAKLICPPCIFKADRGLAHLKTRFELQGFRGGHCGRIETPEIPQHHDQGRVIKTYMMAAKANDIVVGRYSKDPHRQRGRSPQVNAEFSRYLKAPYDPVFRVLLPRGADFYMYRNSVWVCKDCLGRAIRVINHQAESGMALPKSAQGGAESTGIKAPLCPKAKQNHRLGSKWISLISYPNLSLVPCQSRRQTFEILSVERATPA
jgi:hypothetical protein